MSYATGEAAVLTIVRAMTQFDASNSARGDWKPLNSGASDHYAVLKAGAWANVPESVGGGTLTRWRTIVEVWQRWTDDSATVAALQTLVEAVVAQLERYPSLNGTALMAWVAGGGEMQQRWTKEGGPVWAVWEVYVDWQEERFVTIAE